MFRARTRAGLWGGMVEVQSRLKCEATLSLELAYHVVVIHGRTRSKLQGKPLVERYSLVPKVETRLPPACLHWLKR